jgi:NodT family efflux transporter outer membrane factor (OMF) lipoprotein
MDLPRVSAVSGVIAAVVAGCTVGPDFRRPDPPDANRYTETAQPTETVAAPGPAGASQRLAAGQDIPAQWWALFHSTALDQLVRAALQNSPNLVAAQAALRQARENLRAEAGAVLFPSVDAHGSAERQKISGASFGNPGGNINAFDLYNASVSVSYNFDLAGGYRRDLEALQAQVDYQGFQLEGAYLALTANVVTTAVQEASLRAQIRATREILAAQERQLEVVERQFRLGAVSQPDVLAQRTQVAQTRAALPPLEKQLAQNRHRLAVLAGALPSKAALPEFELDGLELPQALPVSLPSSLVRQRPDIRASEALLHQASAQIGVATANLYPQVTLSGSYGSEAVALHQLFDSGTGVWSLGLALLQPIFHGGELTAKRRAAVAAYDQAAAQYRETVLQSFQDVADTLRALESDANALKAQAEAEAAARATLDLTRKQFELGAVSYLSLLNAQRQHQQTRISLVQAEAARFADTAALFQALGGGWWNRPAEAAATPPEAPNPTEPNKDSHG